SFVTRSTTGCSRARRARSGSPAGPRSSAFSTDGSRGVARTTGATRIPRLGHMSAAASPETAPRAITILLADDHRLVRAAPEALLAAHGDLRVVDAVGDAASALLSVAAHRPAVLVLDLTMPGELTALDAIPRLRRDFPDTRVVVLTMQRDRGFARRALRLGALGYVLQESADSQLVA